jgi:hypothetical protein
MHRLQDRVRSSAGIFAHSAGALTPLFDRFWQILLQKYFAGFVAQH